MLYMIEGYDTAVKSPISISTDLCDFKAPEIMFHDQSVC